MKTILILIICLIPSQVWAKRFCDHCYTQAHANIQTVENTVIQNNIYYPPAYKPFQFITPDKQPEIQPLRSFEFDQNIPVHRQPQVGNPQPQKGQPQPQKATTTATVVTSPFIIQNIITTSSSTNVKVFNQGSEAKTKITNETKTYHRK